MKKKIVLTIIIFFTFISLSSFASASISINPYEISIKINDNFNQDNITKKITVENKNSFSYNVTWYTEHPHPSKIRENRTVIPNLSWVDVEPKWRVIPAKEKAYFYIYSSIPKKEKYLDRHWEVWITFKKGEQDQQNGFFNVEHAIRVYIDTPKTFTENGKNIGFEDQDDGLFGITLDDVDNIKLKEIGMIIVLVTLILVVFLYFFKKKK